jgi:hypothetical protein
MAHLRLVYVVIGRRAGGVAESGRIAPPVVALSSTSLALQRGAGSGSGPFVLGVGGNGRGCG